MVMEQDIDVLSLGSKKIQTEKLRCLDIRGVVHMSITVFGKKYVGESD